MILADSRWIGPHGIGRFASEVLKRLPDVQPLQDDLSPVNPIDTFWSSMKIAIARPVPSLYFTPGYAPPIWCGVPFIFTICDLNHLDVPQNSSFLKRLYYRWVMLPACHRASFVLTISEFSRNRILKWSGLPPERVVNISLGVDEQFQPVGVRHMPGYEYLLYVGNHKPHKNLPRLLEAFARSGIQNRVKLIISGYAEPGLDQIIHSLNVDQSVIFAGVILDDVLPAFYRGALALVFPSLYEGFGLPALEAMACGVPVITSNTTSLPEVVGDAALLVNPLDTEEIACAIQQLVEDDALRAELRRKGLERAKLFSWEKTVALTWQVIQEATGQKP